MSSAGSGLGEHGAELALINADILESRCYMVLAIKFWNFDKAMWAKKFVLFAPKIEPSLPVSTEFQLPGRVAMETPGALRVHWRLFI